MTRPPSIPLSYRELEPLRTICELSVLINHWGLTVCKPYFGTILYMPNQSTAVNVHSFTRIAPAPQLPEASDPVPTMRRELKLLRIELERLRAMEDFHFAVIDRIMDSRNQ